MLATTRSFPVSSRVARLVTGLLFILFGAIFVLAGGRLIREEHAFRTNASTVQGEVVGKILRPATPTTSTSYEITYTFPVDQGGVIERTQVVPAAVWDAADVGRPVSVQYISDEPGSARILTIQDMLAPGLAVGMGAVMMLIGSFILLSGAIPARRVPLFKHSLIESRLGRLMSEWPMASFGGMWLLCGLVFLPISIALIVQEHRYQTEGRVIQGMVLTKEFSYRQSEYKARTTSHPVTYRFTTMDGSVLEGKGYVGHETWAALAERDAIDVVYLPRHPSSNRVAGETQKTMSAIFGFIGGFFSLFGGALVYLGIRQKTRRRVAARGEAIS